VKDPTTKGENSRFYKYKQELNHKKFGGHHHRRENRDKGDNRESNFKSKGI
jgi:hypothetical protein